MFGKRSLDCGVEFLEDGVHIIVRIVFVVWGVVDSSLELTASGFGYLENQSFEQTPCSVTAPVWVYKSNSCVDDGLISGCIPMVWYVVDAK